MKGAALRLWNNIKNESIKLLINVINPIKFNIMRTKMGVYVGQTREKKIIISLTSMPQRMDKIHYCIKSLLLQTYRADKIILYLGEEEFEGITLPSSLTNLQEFGLEIKFRSDIKPHKKYFYSMQEFPNDIVITVDDDAFYSKNLICDLISSHLENPKEVICTRAHRMIFRNGILLPYNEWEYESSLFNVADNFLFATGVGGVLYPPHCLHKETFNLAAIISSCLYADDIWLKAMALLNGTSVIAIPSTKTKYVVGIIGAEKTALFKTNVGENRNEEYLRNVFKMYGINFETISRRV